MSSYLYQNYIDVIMSIHDFDDIVMYRRKRYKCRSGYNLNWNVFNIVKIVLKQHGYHYIISWILYITDQYR